jgi:hypothetical protein
MKKYISVEGVMGSSEIDGIGENKYNAFNDAFIDLVESYGFGFGGGTGYHTEEELAAMQEEQSQQKKDAEMYNALRGAGVDNWDGYDDAMKIFRDD